MSVTKVTEKEPDFITQKTNQLSRNTSHQEYAHTESKLHQMAIGFLIHKDDNEKTTRSTATKGKDLPSCKGINVKRTYEHHTGAWSEDEDKLLHEAMQLQKNQPLKAIDWYLISTKVATKNTEQCRERHDYLTKKRIKELLKKKIE